MAPIKRPANVEPVAQNEEEADEEYLNKRARNNDAVKRSRQKAREKANETNSRVQKLKNENEKLEEKIKLLSNSGCLACLCRPVPRASSLWLTS